MGGENVIALDPKRRVRRGEFPDLKTAMLVVIGYQALMLVGMVGAFILTRATAGAAWPPTGQPWFPGEGTALNTAALLASGGLVYHAGRAREDGRRIAHLLLAAIALASFFLLFQGFGWATAIREGLALGSSLHGKFFFAILGTHGVLILSAVLLMGWIWLRLRPFRRGGELQASLSPSAFAAVRFLWYFVVGLWPALWVCLNL
jgi:heme/copper-type cytochrome/quinol oxidase subunit 3